MEHTYNHLLHLLGTHPAWTLAFVVCAAFLESLAFVGTFVPGSTAMFIAGAFAATGGLNLGWLFFWAILGAVAGDGVSFWIGRRYRDSLKQIWPFSRHPVILDRAQAYFVSHGARSVILARFVAPLRAVVPIVAGMAGMTPTRFLVMNVMSALVWAPAHIVPGVVFGASIQLAGAVSFRLVLILAIVALAGWLIWHVSRILLAHIDNWASASRLRAAAWAKQHPGRSARRIARLLDPAQPALGAILVITGLVPVCAAVFSYVLDNVLRGAPLVQLDQSVRQFLHSIHSTWADAALARVETLGSGWTLAALVATVAVWMAFERRWRTIAYWAIAAGVSQLLIVILRFAIHHAAPGNQTIEAYVFPSDRVASMVIVYGFVMFLLVRRATMLEAVMVAAVGNAIVVAVAFAGLYFDRFLFSDAIGGAAFASIWVAAVVLTSLWRYPERPPQRTFMPAIALAVLVAACLAQTLPAGSLGDTTAAQTNASSGTRASVVISQMQWSDSLWRTLACYRFDMKGERREPMTIQWAASADALRAALRDAGWVEGPQLSVKSVLSLVAPNVDVMMLPLLPKLNNGLPSPLVFARARMDDADGDGADVAGGAGGAGSADQAAPLASAASATGHAGMTVTRDSRRDVLRFWPTDYALAPDKEGAAPTPLWVGSLVHERLRRASWPFNVVTPYTDKAADKSADRAAATSDPAHGEPHLSAPGTPPGWRVITLPGDTGCEGRPVKLIVQANPAAR
ncbi:VTT domain-containing protein [Paraburkholderia acidisoli]|uniref:Phosphoesterase n=1 Tax=Paraburkholderia acidisoli TaxID=2571748 RepID=A0A7Z2GLX0_9BURK|nr:VTT domain-containing protein [Paraburkholderia acidisoli]QGZ64031.1 phosphoesterase [Paraburkholderia acidisoli]